MKFIDLYKWLIGTQADFTHPFQNNETLFNHARAFWNQLANNVWIAVLIILFGVILAYCYYGPYNDKPGRHYKPKYWAIFLFATFFVSLILTLVALYIMVKPTMKGAFMLEFEISLANAIYATILYFVVSVVWCQWLPTNACRIFKK